MSWFQSRWLALVWAGFSCTLYAVDGVVLIDQNRALAGNVTPGDTAGFPVTISVSGSYRLSGNLTVPDAETTAILVTADNVTIDLNGFSIIGPVVCAPLGPDPASCTPFGQGVGVDARGGGSGKNNLTVVNGTIRGMGANAVFATGKHAYIEKVRAVSNGFTGLGIGGDAIVTGNIVILNSGAGIDVFAGRATITGNTVLSNDGFGIRTSCPSVVTGNVVANNFSGNISTTGIGCVSVNNAAP
ncbi:MAG TPA: right-handed parallel beta-helix repeat-containing protein [Bryobacteraceae bacterium]|nr:right-handed parallel beta-helix repeat-containing protein [Bryobacteraceae bacterium]